MLRIPCQNQENHDHLIIPHQTYENNEILKIQCKNIENHENLIIPLQNNENHKIIRIPCQNYENHEHKNYSSTESLKSRNSKNSTP